MFAQEERKTPDVVPEGWMTTEQIAMATDKSKNTVLRMIRDSLARGAAEMKTFRVTTRRGPFPIPHYRVKRGA